MNKLNKSLVLTLSLITMTACLPACGKTPEEKLVNQMSGGHYDREKEVERLNALGKSRHEAFSKLYDAPDSKKK